MEQFAQQTGAFGLFINVLPAFKIPIPSIFFSHPLPGGDRFYRDTTALPPFIFVVIFRIYFFFSLPLMISFPSKSIGSFFPNNESLKKNGGSVIRFNFQSKEWGRGGERREINYQSMRSEFFPPPEIVSIKILTCRHSRSTLPERGWKVCRSVRCSFHEGTKSCSRRRASHALTVTDFAGSRMLLKSEDSSNELLFLDARLSNAAINIIGQI